MRLSERIPAAALTLLLAAPLGAMPPNFPAIPKAATLPTQGIQLPPGEWFEAFLAVPGPTGPVVCFSTTDVRPPRPGKHVFRSTSGAPLLIVKDPPK